jgi:hypothetical protein
LNVLLTS